MTYRFLLLVTFLCFICFSFGVTVQTVVALPNSVTLLAEFCFGDAEVTNRIDYSSHTNDDTDLSFVIYSNENWNAIQNHTDFSCQEQVRMADYFDLIQNDRSKFTVIKTTGTSYWFVCVANCGFASVNYRIQYATSRLCNAGIQPMYIDFIFLSITAGLVVIGSIYGYISTWRKKKNRKNAKRTRNGTND